LFDLFVFDMAGTTVQDDGQVPRALVSALAAHGLVVSPEQIAGVRGASKREAIRQFVPAGADQDAWAEIAYVSFRQELARRYRADGVRAVPGADELFAWLRSRGVRVALNTGFDRDITKLLLEALGWSLGTVDAVVCGDDVAHGRPAPDLIHRAMAITGTDNAMRVASVGDTVLDLRAGHAAAVRWNIGVLSGAHDRAQLEAEPHTHLLASVADPEIRLF
jgi:phosphonatase-like hydrolase